MKETTLTNEEQLFCELFVNGAAPYTGNALKCYQEVFHSSDIKDSLKAKKLLARQEIKDCMEKLEEFNAQEAVHMRKYLAADLKAIIEETSTAVYKDRRGTELSPAPLRSVAVSAIKALMDLYPVKAVQESKLSIEGGGENGVIFNVIVPEQKPKDDEAG